MVRVMLLQLEWEVCISSLQTRPRFLFCGGNSFRTGFGSTYPRMRIQKGQSPTVIWSWQAPLPTTIYFPKQQMCMRRPLTIFTTTLPPYFGNGKVPQLRLVQQPFFSVFKPFTNDSFVMFLFVIISLDLSMPWQIFPHDVGTLLTIKFCLILICIIHTKNHGAYVH